MLEFRMTSEFPRGTLYNQLVDAYSFNDECKKTWNTSWKEYDNLKKIIVTTNEIFVSAQRNHESVGFKKIKDRENKETPFSGKYIDYEIKQK